jgi:hypothetical protein
VCAATWDVACATFGACPDAGAKDAGANEEAGPDAADRVDANTMPVLGTRSGCSCFMASAAPPMKATFVALLAAAAALTRRANRSRASAFRRFDRT